MCVLCVFVLGWQFFVVVVASLAIQFFTFFFRHRNSEFDIYRNVWQQFQMVSEIFRLSHSLFMTITSHKLCVNIKKNIRVFAALENRFGFVSICLFLCVWVLLLVLIWTFPIPMNMMMLIFLHEKCFSIHTIWYTIPHRISYRNISQMVYLLKNVILLMLQLHIHTHVYCTPKIHFIRCLFCECICLLQFQYLNFSITVPN